MGMKPRVAASPDHDTLRALAAAIPEAEPGAMFGKACLKRDGKAVVSEDGGDAVFKLEGAAHARALALPGATLWDPSRMNRPMKAWVRVPKAHVKQWLELARAAFGT